MISANLTVKPEDHPGDINQWHNYIAEQTKPATFITEIVATEKNAIECAREANKRREARLRELQSMMPDYTDNAFEVHENISQA